MAVSPFLVLQVRAEARAILFHAFECNLEDAVRPLIDYAFKAGIVDDVGEAAVAAILNSAFDVERAKRAPRETPRGPADGE